MYKEQHTSILRPPAGKKNHPWRVEDTESRTSRMRSRWTWFSEGTAMLHTDPSWVLLRSPRDESWTVLHAGVVLGCSLTKDQACAFPFIHATEEHRVTRIR